MSDIFLVLGPSQCHIICPESIGSLVFSAVVFCDLVALQAKGETLCYFVGKDECALVTWFAASAMKNQIELVCLKSASMPSNMVFYNRDLSPLAEAWMIIFFGVQKFLSSALNSWDWTAPTERVELGLQYKLPPSARFLQKKSFVQYVCSFIHFAL